MLTNGEAKVGAGDLLLVILLSAGWIGLRFPLSFFSDHGCPDFDLWVSTATGTHGTRPATTGLLVSSRRVFRSSREPTLPFASEPHALDEWGADRDHLGWRRSTATATAPTPSARTPPPGCSATARPTPGGPRPVEKNAAPDGSSV